jgi:hypothetical protein
VTGFKLRSEIIEIQVIATGRKIRLLAWLRRLYGKGRWRKLKGKALVEPPGESAFSNSHGSSKAPFRPVRAERKLQGLAPTTEDLQSPR